MVPSTESWVMIALLRSLRQQFRLSRENVYIFRAYCRIAQTVPPELGKQKQWESSPDCKGLRARSGGLAARTGWGATPVAGSGAGEGSPGFLGGSPGRWELARTMQWMHPRTESTDELVVGSPHRLVRIAQKSRFGGRASDASKTRPAPLTKRTLCLLRTWSRRVFGCLFY